MIIEKEVYLIKERLDLLSERIDILTEAVKGSDPGVEKFIKMFGPLEIDWDKAGGPFVMPLNLEAKL